MAEEIYLVYGDKDFSLKFIIKDADGDVEDLSAATCTLKVKKYGGSTLVLTSLGSYTGVDPTIGEVRFPMGTIIWEGIGDYKGEIEINDPEEGFITVPDLVFHVLEELG